MIQEVEEQFTLLITKLQRLCLTYSEAEMQFLVYKMPYFSRLFELIETLERIHLEEIRLFVLLTSGKTVESKPVRSINLQNKSPVEIIRNIFQFEREILSDINFLGNLVIDRYETEAFAFLSQKVVSRYQKIAYKRQRQLRLLENSVVNSGLEIDKLIVNLDIQHLQKHLICQLQLKNKA